VAISRLHAEIDQPRQKRRVDDRGLDSVDDEKERRSRCAKMDQKQLSGKTSLKTSSVNSET
jgi:hypothetical protein